MSIRTKLAELIVDITAKLEPLKGAMAKANGVMKKGLASMTRMAKRAALAIGVALVAAFAWATKAAMVQEDAEMALAQALNETGDATQKNIQALKEYAALLQKTTKFGDEEILAQMAYAKNLGVSTDQLKEAAKAAIGLAAKYKLDLTAAMMLVGRASQGQTQSLTRYGIVLAEGMTAQEKFNAVLAIGTGAFSLAEGEARTTTGILKQLWNVIGDIAELIAAPFLPKLREAATATKEWALENTKLITGRVKNWMDAISDALTRLKPLLGFMAKHPRVILAALLAIIASPFLPFLALMSKGLWKVATTVAIVGRGFKRFLVPSAGVEEALRGLNKLQVRMVMHLLKLKMSWMRVQFAVINATTAFKAATIAGKSFMLATGGILLAPFVVLGVLTWKIGRNLKTIWQNREQLKNQNTFAMRAAKAAASEEERAIKRKNKLIALERKRLAAAAEAARIEAKNTAANIARLKKEGLAKLKALSVYYEKVGGHEAAKAAVDKALRLQEAVDTAKVIGGEPLDIFKELDARARTDRLEAALRQAKRTPADVAQVGLAGFQ